jgi:hypothetical protein
MATLTQLTPALAASCVLVSCLAGASALAQTRPVTSPQTTLLPPDHPAIRASAGGWEIENDKGRKCRVQLNPKEKRPDLVAGVPAPCRRSIPALAGVQGWGLGEDGRVVLRDARGQALGEFTLTGEGPMTGSIGATMLTLRPSSGRYPDPARMAALAAAAAAPQPRDDFTLAPPPPPEQTPGVYAMLRAQKKEACRVELRAEPMQAARGAAPPRPDAKAARFVGNCPDVGISIFDPVGWRMSDQRIFLIARKGHEAGFSHGTDRLWRRDPAVGQVLMMRKE